MFNARCTLRSVGEQRAIVVSGVSMPLYRAGDAVGEAHAMVTLAESGYATQAQVGRVFGCSVRTVRRLAKRYEEGGVAALVTCSGWRKGRRRMPVKRQQEIERLKAVGLSNRAVARHLNVTENAIRKQVGPVQGVAQQLSLPGTTSAPPVIAKPVELVEPVQHSAPAPAPPIAKPVETALPLAEPCCVPVLEAPAVDATPSTVVEPIAPSEGDGIPAVTSPDRDPRDRSFDRAMAHLGLLDDAAPFFADADGVPGAGVLCALPPLVNSGVFRISGKLYGSIGPAFYGQRTTLLVLLFMALWRIKRPENLKERDPASLGLVLGLDRAPEVKTVRRKLTRLAAHHKAEELGKKLASLRVEQRGAMMGFLYVDGHVRAYHGKRDIPKTHVARIRLAMPATTDYWVGDSGGDPLFVLTAEANASLSQMLPEVLAEVRALVGDRRVTIVFDRGGWNLELFKKILDLRPGFDILTYRKGTSPLIDEKLFSTHRAVIDGRRVEYQLHDQTVTFLDGKLILRQVTRLSANGHQTQIITSRFDLPAAEVAYRMFERWVQENFFKYQREEFALDALSDYQVEPGDPTRTVPNPKRRELAKQIKAERQEVKKLEQSLGAALVESFDSSGPALSMFADASKKIDTELAAARQKLALLRAEQKQTPERVEIQDISQGAVIKLATERKHLTNLIKLLAYQAESDLLALLAPCYRRTDDEGRTLLHELFAARADLHPSTSELRVVLHTLSSPHRTAAVASLCEALNDTATRFPGSNLTLRFEVAPLPPTCLAFPGPRPAVEAADPDRPDMK